MGIAYHTTYAPDGTALNLFDRVNLGTVTAVYGVGASAGATVAAAVTWSEPLALPYCAIPSLIEPSSYFITSRTPLGFSLVLTPALTTATLAGGSVEILLIS
jgi:hypothetical protein